MRLQPSEVEMDLAYSEELRKARERPSMYIGPQREAHLERGVGDVLRLMWVWDLIADPSSTVVDLGPSQFHVRCYGGGLDAMVADRVRWSSTDVLAQALQTAGGQVREFARLNKPRIWIAHYRGTNSHPGSFAAPAVLADRYVLAVRSAEGLWCQAYENGWPTSPPYCLQSGHESIALVVAGALSARWFTGLPFFAGDVDRLIPETARDRVQVIAHADDDILPSCAVDSWCALHPSQIGRWL